MEDAAEDQCPFCVMARRSTAGGQLAFSMPDEHPVVVGHTLVVLTRHLSNLLEATTDEWHFTWDLVRKEAVGARGPAQHDGVNIGVNVGVMAGQTVDHAHIHVIPRVLGDTPDPSGGVRNILSQ